MMTANHQYLRYFILVSISISIAAALPARNGTQALPNGTSQQRLGWTTAPNRRGTLDILWSCLFTSFLCSWSMLCLNPPSSSDSALTILHRRFWLTCLCALGPEFTMQIAMGQWISARQSVAAFAEAGYNGWTMSHAFHADMGGSLLQVRETQPVIPDQDGVHSSDRSGGNAGQAEGLLTFPVDAAQLLFLVRHDFVNLPDLTRDQIRDKNKVDGVLRLITLGQTLWFAANTFARVILHLPITCLELTAAAFIFCSVFTIFFWTHKPADVKEPEILLAKVALDQIVSRALAEYAPQPRDGPEMPHDSDDPLRPAYFRTPLEFISRREWHWSLYWSNWINILRVCGINFAPKKLPVDRFENTISLPVEDRHYWVSLAIASAYTSLYVLGWNFEFPTYAEQLGWRIATLMALACIPLFYVITESGFTVLPYLQLRFTEKSTQLRRKDKNELKHARSLSSVRARLHRLANWVRNNSSPRDPALTVPLAAILPIYLLGVCYCSSRTYIILADFIELRSLPAGAYDTVDWSQFIPHL